MKIAIVGAGAIGGYFAARLAASGQQVSMLARGRTLQAIRSHGIRLSSEGRQFAEKVAALPDAQRQGVFMRAITDAGFLCQKIETQAQHAPIDGHPAWSIGCDHGNNYVALAMPGDTLQIVPGTTTAPAAQ